jgi:hypothetical protein
MGMGAESYFLLNYNLLIERLARQWVAYSARHNPKSCFGTGASSGLQLYPTWRCSDARAAGRRPGEARSPEEGVRVLSAGSLLDIGYQLFFFFRLLLFNALARADPTGDGR